MGTSPVIAGAAMTAFGRRPDTTLRELSEPVVADALAQAGAQPVDVQAVFFANAVAGVLTGQEMIRGQAALRGTGTLGGPLVNVENACASGSTALYLAVQAVASGQFDAVLAVGCEKLSHEERARSAAAIATAVPVEDLAELTARSGAGSGSLFMGLYAEAAREYMTACGATAQDFADVVVKSRAHAALNPMAQFREPMTREEVLSSRAIVNPLTLPMCSPIGDGAAAVLVVSPTRAARLGVANPVTVAGCALQSGTDPGDLEHSVARRAAQIALREAGVDIADVDLLEVHDATASAELMIYEELGLCAEGCGPDLLRSGETALSGRRPVNVSGGLLSRGHPLGATGLAQVVELVVQLRGAAGARQVPGARVGLAENSGGHLAGDLAAGVVTVLTR
jgi:acetyl-CoA acetyltransferase